MSRAPLASAVDPFVPRCYRVVERRIETGDVSTIVLEPADGTGPAPRAGQFNMLSAFGVGEVAISVSGTRGDLLEHTIRAVGAVSRALVESAVGTVVGVRGPFGTDWGADDVGDADVVIVAGGIGLAPLRGVVTGLVERSHTRAGRLFLLVGARTPDDVVFSSELESWRASGAYVAVTVDAAERAWRGPVGLVTSLVPAAPFDAAKTVAMVCGPEVMMRYSVRALVDRGVGAASILVSLERNMQCGIGLCGHCQLGPLLLCRDGPIVSYQGVVPELLSRREL